MIKKLTVIGVTAVILAVSAMPAFAAKPVIQACFGHDISGYAQNGNNEGFFTFDSGAGWGGFISFVAQIPGADGQVGVGGEINAHQAGLVPDTTISNSCND